MKPLKRRLEIEKGLFDYCIGGKVSAHFIIEAMNGQYNSFRPMFTQFIIDGLRLEKIIQSTHPRNRTAQ